MTPELVSESRNRTSVLDNGYLELIESWGSDERIIEAARMSTKKGFEGWGGTKACTTCMTDGLIDSYGLYKSSESCTLASYCKECQGTGKNVGDEKLLRYLYEHKHHTPFEMAGMTLEIQAPIFVFREWMRHRSASYNEMSARYTPLPNVNYVPTLDRVMIDGGKNKQAQGLTTLTKDDAEDFLAHLHLQYSLAEDKYQLALKKGIPKELARLVIPVGRYSKMRASANLRNWLHFLTLRMDQAAQWEIRQYANQVAELVKAQFPRTYELFIEGMR